MKDEYPPAYIKEDPDVFDRFSFDYLFKRLLADGYDNEEAKNAILYNCELSLTVMQERIDNDYYLEMRASSELAPDLLVMFQNEAKKYYKQKLN